MTDTAPRIVPMPRTEDDKQASRTRRSMIERGMLNPSPRQYDYNERPALSPENVRTLQARLIKAGILVQNFGVYPEKEL